LAKSSPTRYPYNKQQQQQSQRRGSVKVSGSVSISSPLLPPAILKQYDEIIPTFSQDLHREVLKEGKHRRSCDSWLIKGGTIRAVFGQVCALVITLATLYVALQLGLAGYTWTAAIIVAVNLAGLVGAFLGREIITRRTLPNEEDLPHPPQIDEADDYDDDEPPPRESLQAPQD
jgi:uncharacterized membrane protein